MELASHAFPIAILLAFALGALSFLSPCVLPIVPPYLAYMSGVRMDEIEHPSARRKMVISSSYFVLGLSTVFLLMAIGTITFTNILAQYKFWFDALAGSILIVFGLHFLGLFNLPFLDRELRLQSRSNTSPFGAYLLGLAFAFGWSPCLGPALGAILTMISQEGTMGRGLILMAFYAIGLGLPFVLSAVFMAHFMRAGSKFKSKMGIIKSVMGLLLILIGVLMVTGNFSEISNWMLNQFPALGGIG